LRLINSKKSKANRGDLVKRLRALMVDPKPLRGRCNKAEQHDARLCALLISQDGCLRMSVLRGLQTTQ
jgi:hypothetical protein